MKRKLLFLSLALLSALVFTSCDNEHPEVDILLERDFTEVIQAINDANRSLSDKMALIEGLLNGTSERDQSLTRLVQAALSSLSGTVDQKLAAIQDAVNAGNTSLETKLALIQAAVQGGFSDYEAQQALLRQALQSIEGSAEQKLADIENAIKAQTSSLETKLGLIEAAFQNGFADSAKAGDLLAEAINATGKTLEEKLAAIETAIGSQTASLEAKIALVEAAVKEGFADAGKQEELIQQAVAALQGTIEEKLSAIESAVKSDNTGLGAKLELISAALEQGIGDQNTAIGNMQTALDATIQGIGANIETVKANIINGLTALSGQLTTEELAKVFKGFADAIGTQGESGETLLENLLKAIDDLEQSFEPQIEITLLEDISKTVEVVLGSDFSLKLAVNPANTVLEKDNLRVQIVSRKTFLPEELFTLKLDVQFAIKSMEADPAVPGQYLATISTSADYYPWEESILSLVYKYGPENKQKEVSTKAFPITVLPPAGDGLARNCFPKASFLMRDTVIVGGNKTIVDTLGVIYYALGDKVFTTKDGKESRTYTVDNISKVRFVQPDQPDTAAVFTAFNKEKHFVRFWANHDHESWDSFKDNYGKDHSFQEVSGKLALTDRWGATDSLYLSMRWYVTWPIVYEMVENIDNLKPGDFEWTGKTYAYKYPQVWPNLLNPWGLDYYYIKSSGLKIENVTRGCGYGYKLLRLNMGDVPATPILEAADAAQPVKGDKYQTLGVFRLRSRPSDVDPDFQPTQFLYKYQIALIVDGDDTD